MVNEMWDKGRGGEGKKGMRKGSEGSGLPSRLWPRGRAR